MAATVDRALIHTRLVPTTDPDWGPGFRPAMAALRSSRLKKVRLRRHARIQRCATSTAVSTFALSRGLPGRAGTMARS